MVLHCPWKNWNPLFTMEVFNGFFFILFFAVLTDFCNALEPEEVVDVSQSKALTLKGGQNMTEEAKTTGLLKLCMWLYSQICDFPGKPALAKTKPSNVKLNWTKELEIEVTFANGTKEKIHLKAVADLKREKILCLYTGSLDHDAEHSAPCSDCWRLSRGPSGSFCWCWWWENKGKEEGVQVAENYDAVHDYDHGQWTPPEAPSFRWLWRLRAGWRSPCPCHSRWTELSINRGSYCIY